MTLVSLRGARAERRGGGDPATAAAPLSVSVLALFGAVTLPTRREDDRIEGE